MSGNRKGFLLLSLVLLLLAVPLLAHATDTAPAPRRIDPLASERAFADYRDITLTPGSTIAEALDWLDGFMHNEIGYARTYLVDLLEMVPIANTNGATGAPAAAVKLEALFQENAQIYTTLAMYQTKLLYAYERIDFLVNFIHEPSVSTAYRQSLEEEIDALKGEAASLLAMLAVDQATAINAISTLQQNMLSMEGVEDIRAYAQPSLRGVALSLQAVEAPGFVSGNQTDITVLSTKEIAVLMVDKQPGVTVKMWQASDTGRSSMKTVTTDKDGAAIFWIADFKPSSKNEVEVAIEVTMDGMRTKEVERVKLEGAHGVWLKLEKDDGTPYFTMLCYNGKDMLSRSNEIFIAKGNDLIQNIHFKLDTKGHACTVELRQGRIFPTVHAKRTVAAGSRDVVTMDDLWCRKFSPDYALDFVITYDGKKDSVRAKLMPKQAPYDEPQQHEAPPTFLMPDLSLRLPESIPVVGGGTLTFPLPFEKLKIYADLDGTLFIGLGKLIVPDAGNWKSRDQADRDDMQEQLKKESIANMFLYEAKTAWKEANTRKSRLFGSSEADFSPYAYAMMHYDKKAGWAEGGAVAGIRIAYSFEVTQTFSFGPVPGYIGFDMNASVGVGAELSLGFRYPSLTNWRVTKGSGIHFDFGIGIGVTAGAGIPKLAYVQLRGSFSTGVAIVLAAKSEASATIYVGLDLEVKLLFFSKSWNLAKWQYPAALDGDMQARLVQSAQYRQVYLDPMDISQFPTFEDVMESYRDPLPPSDGSIGLKPDRTIMFGHTYGFDTNIKFIRTDKHYYAFTIARLSTSDGFRTRLHWVDLDTANDIQVRRGYLPDNIIGRTNDIFDYDFDVAYYKDGSQERIVLTVQSGTREGIRELGPNATDEEREAEMHKARLQTHMYGITYQIGADGTLINPDGFEFQFARENRYLHMPRVTALREPLDMQDSHGQTMRVFAAHGCAYMHYSDQDHKTPEYVFTTNTFSAMNGKSPNAAYLVMAHMYPSKYTIDDITLLDFAVKSKNGYLCVPVVCVLHARDGGKDMVVTITDGGELTSFPRIEDSFNTISPIKMAVSPSSSQERTEGVFLLQNTGSASKGKQTKVSALWVDGNPRNMMDAKDVKMVYRDYGMYIGADGLDTTTVFWGTDNNASKQLYAYWPQSIDKNGKYGSKLELRAVLLDIKQGLISPSFSFLELPYLPVRANVFSALATDDKVRCYFLGTKVDDVHPGTLYSVGVEFRYKAIAALESVVAQYPVIGVGDPLSLIASIKNEGDLVIEKIALDLYNGSTRFAQVVIDAVNDKSTIQRYDQYGLPVNIPNHFGPFTDEHSVFRLPGIYDEINCEVVITQDGEFGEDGTLRITSQEPRRLEGLMPGHVRAYKIQLNSTPAEWHGKQTIRVEVAKLNASFSLGGDTGEDGTVEYEIDVKNDLVTETVYGNTNSVESWHVQNGLVGYGTPVDDNGTQLDVAIVDLAYNDQALDVDIDYFDDVPYAVIALNNYGHGTALASPPVLTSYIDGKAIYSHAFTQPLDPQNGYMLRMPLYQLTGGNPYERLEVRLTSVAKDADFREFADVDNSSFISARAHFEIIPPESLIRYEGEDAAFSISVIGDTGPYTYQWYYRYPNGTTPILMEGATGPAIELTDVQLSDDGKAFWCYVYDRYGNGKASGEATLTVLVRTFPPQTGDDWPFAALLITAAGALIALSVYTAYRKRRAGGDLL